MHVSVVVARLWTLLLRAKDRKQQFVLIKEFERYMNRYTKRAKKALHGLSPSFYFSRRLTEALRVVFVEECQGPSGDDKVDSTLKFGNYEKQFRAPFVICAEFNCVLAIVSGYTNSTNLVMGMLIRIMVSCKLVELLSTTTLLFLVSSWKF